MSALSTQEIPERFQELGPDDDDTVSVVLRLVAVRGVIGDWAAYFGNGDSTVEEVAQYGHKLPEHAARMIFGNVRGRYRE